MTFPKPPHLFVLCILSVCFQQAIMQCLVAPGCCECVHDVGVDYEGADLSEPAVGVKSVEDCQQICNLQSECYYFAYATTGEYAGYCWQKGFGFNAKFNPNITSGRRCVPFWEQKKD